MDRFVPNESGPPALAGATCLPIALGALEDVDIEERGMVTDKRISDSLPTLPGETWHADPPQHDALLQRWVGANARVAHTLVSGSPGSLFVRAAVHTIFCT